MFKHFNILDYLSQHQETQYIYQFHSTLLANLHQLRKHEDLVDPEEKQ